MWLITAFKRNQKEQTVVLITSQSSYYIPLFYKH
jgi:hypothetical protein